MHKIGTTLTDLVHLPIVVIVEPGFLMVRCHRTHSLTE